jgi:hypothetical protein
MGWSEEERISEEIAIGGWHDWERMSAKWGYVNMHVLSPSYKMIPVWRWKIPVFIQATILRGKLRGTDAR